MDSSADRPMETGLLRAVFDSLGVGMLVTDNTGAITASNPFARHVLGRSQDQLLGYDLHDLMHRHADGSRVARNKCRALGVIDTGQPAEGSDEYYLRSDGTLMPINWVATPLQHEGLLDGVVLVFQDFKEHREATDQTAAHLAALEGLTARLSLVGEVSALLISTLDTSEMLDRLVRLLGPELGDWAVIDLAPVGPEGMRRVAVHTPEGYEVAESLKGPLPPLPRNSRTALSHAMERARPAILDSRALAGNARKPLAQAHRQLVDRLGGHSAVVVPLYTLRRVFGTLTVARTGGRKPEYTEAELHVLADIGRRVGLVMESNELFAQQRHVAETMQRQLLTPLPQVNHLRFAARYKPAEQVAEIGGDWYDAFLLADGVMAMVIGDVVGHDLQAAAHMAEVRNMLRALAWDRQEPPSLVVRLLDEAMTNTSDAAMATTVFARIEGAEGGPWHLHWVNAGHPPPLLITADGRARYLEGGHGPLLGMSATLRLGLTWPDAREEIPARSTLLFYTDGLVESRYQSVQTGLDELCRHASDLADRDLEDFLDELLTRIDPSGDDVALLALRIPPPGAGAEGDTQPPPPQEAYSPAATERHAPGSRVEDTSVRDTSDPKEEEGKQE